MPLNCNTATTLPSYHGVEHVALGQSVKVLTQIFQSQINLAVLKRTLSKHVAYYACLLIETRPAFNLRCAIQPDKLAEYLESALPASHTRKAFIDDLVLLVEMYACLFDLAEVGVRLQVLDKAMCPRFHVDKLGCRMISTYSGIGTEWLDNHSINREQLVARSRNLKSSDESSGLYTSTCPVNRLDVGDVALLKGEGWFDNEGGGIVHRSPALDGNQKRLVLTVDFA